MGQRYAMSMKKRKLSYRVMLPLATTTLRWIISLLKERQNNVEIERK